MSQIPFTTNANLFLQSTGDGQKGSVWSNIYDYETDTYSVSGTLVVPSGATGYLPPFFKVFAPGAVLTLIGIIAMVRSGSCTLSIDQNGTAVTGLTGLSITTTATTTTLATPVAVSLNDYFAPVISAVSAADGLSLTLVFGKVL